MQRRSSVSSARNGDAPSASSPASSAISSSPRTPCRMRSRRRSSAGLREGLPRTPGAWIVTTARNRAIDRIRREKVFQHKAELIGRLQELPAEEDDVSAIPDERLALVFTCCHPALAAESRVALTLARGRRTDDRRDRARVPRRRAGDGAAPRPREAEDPRSGHPVPRAAGPPAPRAPALRSRRSLPRVQRGIRGNRRHRPRACRAVRGGDPARKAPRRADAGRGRGARAARAHASPGLASRSAGRPATARSCCSRIRTARSGIEDASTRACASSSEPCRCGALARTSSRRRSLRRTPRIGRRPRSSSLYAALAAIDPSPVVELNHAVAVALAGDVEGGLMLLDGVEGLDGYHLLHAARADLYRRLERHDEAATSYRRALELTTNDSESRFLEQRLAEVS